MQDGDTCVLAHWRNVLAAKGYTQEQIKALSPIVYRCSNHFNTNTNKQLSKLHAEISKLGSKAGGGGSATKEQFTEVNRRMAVFVKKSLPLYDSKVSQAGGAAAEQQDQAFTLLAESIALHSCGDHSKCKAARDGMRKQLGESSVLPRCLLAVCMCSCTLAPALMGQASLQIHRPRYIHMCTNLHSVVRGSN